MNRLAPIVGLTCAAVVAGGCGGSKHATTTTTTTGAAASSSSASSSTAVASQSSTTTSSASASVTTASTHTRSAGLKHARSRAVGQGGGKPTSSGGGSVRGGGAGSGGSGRGGVSQPKYARLGATFTIMPGGLLDPTAVSLPSVRALKLAVVSRDGRRHQVQLRTATAPRVLTVAPHGRASVVIGIGPGRYVVDVDGLARGLVLIGGSPAAP